MSERLRRRTEQIRQRALIRSWEYRQRDYANGVWDRFRRLLVDAAEAWVIDDGDARRLAESGRAEQAVGAELDPPKRIYFVSPQGLVGVSSRRQVPVRLKGELLQARNLALVPFDRQNIDSPGEEE